MSLNQNIDNNKKESHKQKDEILLNIKDLQKQITSWQNENTNKLDEIKLSITKFEKFIFWYRVSKVFKFLIIILPIILTYFFVLPWFNDFISKYTNDFYLMQNERIDKAVK